MDHFLALPPDGFKPLWTGLVAPATILTTLRTVHGSHAAETTKLGSFDFANNQRLTNNQRTDDKKAPLSRAGPLTLLTVKADGSS
jgi:hypothetical protein